MRKQFTLILLSNSGSPLRQVHLSAPVVCLLLALTLLLAGFVGYTAYDYAVVKSQLTAKAVLDQELKRKTEEISTQRRQIQKFAGDINALKQQLVALHDFQKQIRIIANIDAPDKQDTLHGMGGSIPEDLDASSDLRKKNDGLVRAMHEQLDQLDTAALHQEREFEHLLERIHKQHNLLASTPAIRPTDGWITSRFGYRQSPFTGRRELHKGLDISNRTGTPILATADGVVRSVGKNGLYGLTLVIDHGHGLQTRYAHLNKALKKKREHVKRGDVIAQMGSSGRSTGPHLHYEVRLNGVPVNPAKYILN
ncbi:MAG: peptidoglycan DD-metalloendopeptidase family protein [Desulfosarcinaceae bacterium]|nr:peptidoglycan DD-metalloendopeptidase family protein [Desulfosarcinaceae bacterium]